MKHGLMQITRVDGGKDDLDEVQLQLIANGHHIRVGIDLDQFTRMVMGEKNIPCTVRRWESTEDQCANPACECGGSCAANWDDRKVPDSE
jgi:hypothetical protein